MSKFPNFLVKADKIELCKSRTSLTILPYLAHCQLRRILPLSPCCCPRSALHFLTDLTQNNNSVLPYGMSHPTTPGVDSTLTPSSDDGDHEEDEGLMLERLALLMPLVQEAVTNFGRARDSDDLPQQQQVCDTLVEQATTLLLAQDGDSTVAALLVHVLLDRVYTAGVFHGEVEPEEYADDSALWEKLGLPSLRDSRGDSPSSSSSSSVLEPLPRGPTNQPPDLSPLVPRMLELAWQKERGQEDEQAYLQP